MTSIPRLYIRVLGRRWKIRLLTKKQYRKKNGTDSLACTKAWKRTVDLSPKGRDKETICHELVHCYLSEMCIYGLDTSPEYLEEVFAELLSKRGRELLSLADSLFLRVKLLSSKVG